MDPQNLSYTLVQFVHNFGAAAVVGGAFFARWSVRPTADVLRQIAWLVLFGWIAQAASGISFGIVSYAFYGRLPDIHGIAIAALTIKIACAAAALLLVLAYLFKGTGWTAAGQRRVWASLFGLGATALTAAAFLRWFS